MATLPDNVTIKLRVQLASDTAALLADAVAALATFRPEPAAETPGVHVREVDGGAVLAVPSEIRQLLIEFGWFPPVDGDEPDA